MITREKEKMVDSKKVKMCDFRQDREKLLEGMTKNSKVREKTRKSTEKRSDSSILEPQRQLPEGLNHKDRVLRAISGFFSDSKRQNRTSSGQLKRNEYLFGHRNKGNGPKAAIL
jgi:hypothetical protein